MFSLTTISILGVGLGAATAIFSICYGILVRPLPYPSPGALARIDWVMPTGQSQGSSLGDLQERDPGFPTEHLLAVSVSRAYNGGTRLERAEVLPPVHFRTYLFVALTVTGTALVACYPPILRASRIDPMSLLKEE